MQQEHQTELLIGEARHAYLFARYCTPARKERKSKLRRRKTKRETIHTSVHQSVQRQLSMARHFLHERPVHASSWCMPEKRDSLSDGTIHLVQGPMCRWRKTATDDRDEQGFVRGKTRWATSSSRKSSSAVDRAERDNRGSDALTETFERSVESAREAAG